MDETVESIAGKLVAHYGRYSKTPFDELTLRQQIGVALVAERQRADELAAENAALREALSDAVKALDLHYPIQSGSALHDRIKDTISTPPSAHLPALVARVKAEETERCAKIADAFETTNPHDSDHIAAAIRAKE